MFHFFFLAFIITVPAQNLIKNAEFPFNNTGNFSSNRNSSILIDFNNKIEKIK